MSDDRRKPRVLLRKGLLLLAFLALLLQNHLLYGRLRQWYDGFDFEAARMAHYTTAGGIVPLLLMYMAAHFLAFAALYYLLDFNRWRYPLTGRKYLGWLRPVFVVGVNVAFIALFFLSLELPFARLAQQQKSIVTYHPRLTYQFVPRSSSMSPDGRKTYIVNSFGFRGQEIERVKPPNTVRIFFLGDSALYAIGTDTEQSPGAVLQRLLENELPKRRFEVLNASIPVSSTIQGLYILERWIAPLEPDVVLVGFNNDSEGGQESTEIPAGTALLEKLVIRSGLVRIFCEASCAENSNKHNLGRKNLYGARVSVNDLRGSMGRMAALAKRDGFRLIFMGMPEYITPDNTRGFVHLSLEYRALHRKFAAEVGCPYLSFKDRWGNKDPDLFTNDRFHLSPDGCTRLASDIADYLVKNRMLQAGSSRQ